MQYKVLHFEQAPWKVGEKEADRNVRVKNNEHVDTRDCYPDGYPGKVISVIPATESFSRGDIDHPSRAVVTLELTNAERVALASRKSRIEAGSPVPVTFDERWGRLAEVLHQNFDDPEKAERESEDRMQVMIEGSDGWRFAEITAFNKQMLPQTVKRGG